MAIHMINTWLESSAYKFFEILIWVPFGVPLLIVKSDLYASFMYFYSKIEMNYVNLIIVWVHCGTRKIVSQTFKAKPPSSISHM